MKSLSLFSKCLMVEMHLIQYFIDSEIRVDAEIFLALCRNNRLNDQLLSQSMAEDKIGFICQESFNEWIANLTDLALKILYSLYS